MKYRTIHEVVEGWEDTSWGNDECQSFTLGALRLFVDDDHHEHEDPEVKRYSLHVVDEHGECQYPRLHACDSGGEMVEYINAHIGHAAEIFVEDVDNR